MKDNKQKERILILGGSGFIGQALYKELQSYYDVHGTYCTQNGMFSGNQVFHRFCLETDSTNSLLKKIRPTIIIFALKGNPSLRLKTLESICEYVKKDLEKSVFLISSRNVFDAKTARPAYEDDVPLSISAEGKTNIALEKLVIETIPDQHTIVRLPLVLGINSPVIFHLRQCIKHQATFEIYPNLVVTAITIQQLQAQIHYMINRSFRGVFHPASENMIHHDELFIEICEKIGDKTPIFKNVYSSNEDKFSALLSSKNKLPAPYRVSIEEVIQETALNETTTSLI